MTAMKRMTISLSPEQDAAILAFRKSDQYCRMSYTGIIRLLLDEGIKRAGLNPAQSTTPEEPRPTA